MIARVLMIDQEALEIAHSKGDLLLANEIFMNAFYTDVRPFLASWRESRGLPSDPIGAYARSEYGVGISRSRSGSAPTEWL
jgi:L-rhamnose isomerase/sugar isomerase